MKELEKLHKRLEKLNIKFACWTNYPWVYIYRINEHVVSEKYGSEHGFVIGYLNPHVQKFEFNNTSELFRLIRNYINK
jgi:hypothetical protein